MNKTLRHCLLLLLLAMMPCFLVFPQQREWYVSGPNKNFPGNDQNDGTREQPLSSVQRALRLIKNAYEKEPFETAIINIDGMIEDLGQEAEIFGIVTIRGNEYPSIIIRGMDSNAGLNARENRRVIYLENSKKLTIEKLIITGGRASTGAGIYAAGSDLIIEADAIIRDNTGGFGGGIYVEGGTCVFKGTVSGNRAENGGGGAFISGDCT